LALLILAGGGCAAKQSVTETPKDTSPIKIGWMGPLTGDVATVGEMTKKATTMAVKEINDTGGIDGLPLEVVYEDSACDAKTGSNAGNKLINVEKVTAIVGELCSGPLLAIAPVAEQNHTVLIGAGTTAPAITDAGDYIFRVVPSDSYQGKYAANYVYNTMGKRKAAVLFAKADYTEGLATVFTSEFKKLGGEVVLTDSFLQTDRDLRTQLTKVKDSGADMLYFPTYTEAGVAGVKQAQEMGLNTQIFGSETVDDPKFYGAQGAEGIVYTKPTSYTNEEFKTKFLTATDQKELPVYVTQSYDAMKIVAEALKQSGNDSAKLKNALYQIKNYDGVSGKIGFDQNGDLTTANYEVYKVVNGEPVKQ